MRVSDLLCYAIGRGNDEYRQSGPSFATAYNSCLNAMDYIIYLRNGIPILYRFFAPNGFRSFCGT